MRLVLRSLRNAAFRMRKRNASRESRTQIWLNYWERWGH